MGPHLIAALGDDLSLLWVLPFVGMVLAIAILPMITPSWYEPQLNKAFIAALLGVPVVVYLLAALGPDGRELVLDTFAEYLSFIILLGSLFVIAGGLYLTGNLRGTPGRNLAFLAAGGVLANLIGTTGAAMVLIRPILRANSERRHVRHIVVFAIFVVGNIGGLLTPLGDPPLFLGFLNGVDFFWTLRLAPHWLVALGLTLAVFYLVDRREYRRETPQALREDLADYVPLRLHGGINLLFLGGVVAAVLLSRPLEQAGDALGVPGLRELVMIAMALLSLTLGPREPRVWNRFSWTPMAEVAIVFAGIFATMIPALAILEARGDELGLTQPWHYFWLTGSLSSFLDNAPTYLTFTSVAQGYLGIPELSGLMSSVPQTAGAAAPAAFLAAVSTGAVFMGANSYIGNAPNFMIKSIAEEHGVRMPSFFGYMGYSALVLLPVFVIVTLLFFA
jgi:Na+/H+ antiporter NhaD/arsenite permease-like protein